MGDDITHQDEPVRKSLYDVLRQNLERAEKATFVHRLIYIGAHLFSSTSECTLGQCMQSTIERVNDDYNDEPLTGVLLSYSQYFCHILEGSEDSLLKHLLLLSRDEANSSKFISMKMLVCYHHINQRFLPGWFVVTARPPLMLEKISTKLNLFKSSRYVCICVEKLYKFCRLLRMQLKNTTYTIANRRKGSLISIDLSVCFEPFVDDMKANIIQISESNSDCLPENALLEFLLCTPYTLDLDQYIKTYSLLPPLDSYKDKVWPVPSEFVPMHIFDEPYDPVPDIGTRQEDASISIILE